MCAPPGHCIGVVPSWEADVAHKRENLTTNYGDLHRKLSG